MGLKSTTGGEIVQVQGGHIIRATGRKDRHSKVFTAKGPRDRRVRLSAHTAIQFYDVQDRLGYDRPSKAVDWLIKKAKASIDKLAELPPWDPIASASNTVDVNNNNNNNVGCNNNNNSNNNNSDFHHVGEHSGGSSFYVPQCVDNSVSLGETMKSFFPTTNTSGENNISFENYQHELISRGATTQQNQDLCLSLHTLQDPRGGSSGQHPSHSSHGPGPGPDPFHGSGPSLGFDGGWAEPHQQHDLGRFTRIFGWPGTTSTGSAGVTSFNPQSLQTPGFLFGQQGPMTTTTYSQRGTLQSSFSPLFRGFEDHHHHQHHPQEISGVGQESDGFLGFYIPAQMHGELHGGANSMSTNRASSSSMSPDNSQH